jgi:hypothetical protein
MEWQDLRRRADLMVPASAKYGVPGADDAAIFADIVRSLGHDRDAVRGVMALLCEIAGDGFAHLDAAKAGAAAMTLLNREGLVVTVLGRAGLLNRVVIIRARPGSSGNCRKPPLRGRRGDRP